MLLMQIISLLEGFDTNVMEKRRLSMILQTRGLDKTFRSGNAEYLSPHYQENAELG